MKRRKIKRKPNEGTPQSQHGYDFGTPERLLLVANNDFLQSLSEADIIACAYSIQRNNELQDVLPIVDLVGKHAEAFKSAFRELTKLGANEDGDVVELTFVFLAEGGYLLDIRLNPERLSHRLRGYDRVFEPLQLALSWTKKFDSRHPMLQQLADYKKTLISPFLFSAIIHPPVDNLSSLNVNSVQSIEGLEPILKFEARFTREEDVKDRSQEWWLLQRYRSKDPASASKEDIIDETKKSPKIRSKNDPKFFRERRQEMLNCHFPVTLFRTRRSKLYRAYKEDFANQGVQPWQVEQAICNLVLSRAISGKDHYSGFSEKDCHEKIISTLQGRFELADSQDCATELPRDVIQRQIELDCQVLLGHFGIKKIAPLCTLIAQLGKEGLLHD